MKTKAILAYLAGAMDSDGFFTMRHSTYGIRVRQDCINVIYYERVGIKQTSPEIVNLIHEHFGGYRGMQKPNTKNGKLMYSIELTNLKAHAFVKALLPYLRIKRRQAEILLDLRKSLNSPRKTLTTRTQNSRWGSPMTVKRWNTSQEELNHREAMLAEIKSLNDSRTGHHFTPKAV